MPEKLFDYLSRISDENTVINICDKDDLGTGIQLSFEFEDD